MRGSGRIFFVAAALAVCVAHAEEKSAPPPSGAGETSISAAKREFDAVKASRDAALQQKGDSPRIATPELQTGLENNAPRPWAKKKEDELLEKQKKGKSENWLIEGIEKEKLREKAVAAGRDPDAVVMETEREARNPTTGEKADALAQALTGEKGDANSAKEKEKDRERPTNAVNPLARYMSDWMTPQDFSLLQANGATAKDGTPAASASGGTSSATLFSNSGGSGAATSGGLEASLTGLGLGGGTKSNAPAAAHENPFLQGLGGTAPASSLAITPPAALAPPPPPSTPATSIFVPPPADPIPTRSSIPDFAKPSDDAKALKPLKRF